RWKIEECFETGKAIGLEDYQVRSYTAWYRHVTLVMLVQAYLAGICAVARSLHPKSRSSKEPSLPCALLPLTLPEVRHLFALLLWPLPRSPTLLLSWSWWRRSHQSRASYFHTKRRCAAG